MIFFSLLLIPLVAHSEPFTTVINDKDTINNQVAYWGGSINYYNSYSNRDVIGDPFFSVDQMTVVQNGNIWTVTLTGPYFTWRNDVNADGGLPSKLDPGDLYISSTGYSAVGDDGPHFASDTFLQNELWDYVVPLTASSGLYDLNFSGITMTNVSTAPSGNYIYRTNQAWQGGADLSNNRGWATSEFSDSSLIFTFDATNLNFTSGTVGFHWTMQCGNDVLEGAVPARDVPSVPEPSTLLLLGLGLTGVVAYKKVRS